MRGVFMCMYIGNKWLACVCVYLCWHDLSHELHNFFINNCSTIFVGLLPSTRYSLQMNIIVINTNGEEIFLLIIAPPLEITEFLLDSDCNNWYYNNLDLFLFRVQIHHHLQQISLLYSFLVSYHFYNSTSDMYCYLYCYQVIIINFTLYVSCFMNSCMHIILSCDVSEIIIIIRYVIIIRSVQEPSPI